MSLSDAPCFRNNLGTSVGSRKLGRSWLPPPEAGHRNYSRLPGLHVVCARPQGVEMFLDPSGGDPQAVLERHLGLPARQLEGAAVVAEEALDLAPRRAQAA